MSRLTKTTRDAFVAAVMADVPSVDYVAKVRKFLEEAIYERLPDKVRHVYDDPLTRPFLKSSSWWIRGLDQSLYLYCHDVLSDGALPDDVRGTLQNLVTDFLRQKEARKKMRDKLSGLIAGYSTVAAAAKGLPELEKYLPAPEPKKTPNLPAVSNVVADLSKLGWPKGEKT